MRVRFLILATFIAFTLNALPALAHHSVSEVNPSKICRGDTFSVRGTFPGAGSEFRLGISPTSGPTTLVSHADLGAVVRSGRIDARLPARGPAPGRYLMVVTHLPTSLRATKRFEIKSCPGDLPSAAGDSPPATPSRVAAPRAPAADSPELEITGVRALGSEPRFDTPYMVSITVKNHSSQTVSVMPGYVRSGKVFLGGPVRVPGGANAKIIRLAMYFDSEDLDSRGVFYTEIFLARGNAPLRNNGIEQVLYQDRYLQNHRRTFNVSGIKSGVREPEALYNVTVRLDSFKVNNTCDPGTDSNGDWNFYLAVFSGENSTSTHYPGWTGSTCHGAAISVYTGRTHSRLGGPRVVLRRVRGNARLRVQLKVIDYDTLGVNQACRANTVMDQNNISVDPPESWVTGRHTLLLDPVVSTGAVTCPPNSIGMVRFSFEATRSP